MIQSAVTVSLVPQAKGGPFIYWFDLAGACAQAAALGFDGIEVFPPAAEVLSAPRLKELLTKHNLKLAAVGTGAGWLLHKMRLTDPDPVGRARARQFIAALVDFAGSFGAPAIIGSMQGRVENDETRERALGWLREALEQLGPRAHAHGVPLLFEPLNRYETNLINSLADGVDLVQSLRTQNVKLLGDLFHMNLEEASIPDALRAAAPHLGHIHFVDSNRRPAGSGHTDFAAVSRILVEINYAGFLSAEALPYPNSEEAARQTMVSFKKYFRAGN
jgi:sugar phosphate isomerase/epimerase